MDEREKQQIIRVHGKHNIGRYEFRTGRLLDSYDNPIDIWGNLLNKPGQKTKDSNY